MSTFEITPANRIVEQHLDYHLREVQSAFGHADAIAFIGPLFFGVDESIREAVESIHKNTGAKRLKPWQGV